MPNASFPGRLTDLAMQLFTLVTQLTHITQHQPGLGLSCSQKIQSDL